MQPEHQPVPEEPLAPKDRIRQTIAIAFAGLTIYALFIKIVFF